MIGKVRCRTRIEPDQRVADALLWIFGNASGCDAELAYETCADFLRGNGWFVAESAVELRTLALEHTELSVPRKRKG